MPGKARTCHTKSGRRKWTYVDYRTARHHALKGQHSYYCAVHGGFHNGSGSIYRKDNPAQFRVESVSVVCFNCGSYRVFQPVDEAFICRCTLARFEALLRRYADERDLVLGDLPQFAAS